RPRCRRETAMAGYSGTPLPQKLGLKPGHRLRVAQAPPEFAAALGPLPEGVELVGHTATGVDLAVLFVADLAELRRRFSGLARRLAPAGALWVAWPKKASGVATDLTENVVRDHGLGVGLVDVKVCAIDEVWSGLKFV